MNQSFYYYIPREEWDEVVKYGKDDISTLYDNFNAGYAAYGKLNNVGNDKRMGLSQLEHRLNHII